MSTGSRYKHSGRFLVRRKIRFLDTACRQACHMYLFKPRDPSSKDRVSSDPGKPKLSYSDAYQ